MIGWVPSVVPYLEKARVCVVPLLYGAGVKGKVLQALMRGTPVVTTSIGAEGLDLVNDVHAVIADTPVGLADGITRLLSEADPWTRISEAGRDHVLALHDEDAVRGRFLRVVEDVIARPAADGIVPEAFLHSRRRYEAYRRTVTSVQEVVRARTDPGSVVLVISKGDDELIALDGRTAWHFPRTSDGRWAGYHPADDRSAIEHLENQRACGARYLVLPETSFWWLHHYCEFVSHLEASYARLHSDQHLIMYDLSQRLESMAVDDLVSRPEAAHVLVVGTHDRGRGPGSEQIAALENSGRYEVQYWNPTGGNESDTRPVAESAGTAIPDWVVHVQDAAVVRPGFLDDFLALADRLGAERAQAPHTSGPGAGPPITEQLRGCVARQVSVLTQLPVKAVRSGAASDGPTLLTDAVPLAVSKPFDRDSDDTATSVLDVLVHGRDGPAPGVRRTGQGPSPLITVVIATYDRPELLSGCLEGFCCQTLDDRSFEVVVVDDGSPGGLTRAVLDAFADRLRLCHVRIEHAGRASAKNLGVLLARGELVLFFDDDDRPEDRMLEEHLLAHQRHSGQSVAVLGYTDWAPELELTPLMHFLTNVDKVLFSYGNLSEGTSLDWRCFWEGRVSCKRSFLMRHGLHDQRLAYSIDVEMGLRLAKHGLEVRYWPAARSYMTRPVGLDDFCARTEGKGRAQATMAMLHPDKEVQRYARTVDAPDRWRSAQPHLPGLMVRARELEARLPRSWRPDDPRLDDLYQCYRSILDAYNAKGVSENIDLNGNEGVVAPATATERNRAAGRTRSEQHPVLTITIPVWSRTPELAEMATRTVDRIWEVSRLPSEVVIIDNGSPHERRFPAKVHRFPENRGVSAAWNEGIARAEAPVVAVLNSDCMVEPGWDEALYEAATAGRRIGFPYTDHGDGRGFRQPDQGGTSGWCFALAVRLFREIGPFDERFSPAFCEDTDYWHRAWELGVELSPVPAAHVTHVRRATTGLDAHVDWLLQGHRYKYGWKHGVDPHRAPPYYNRPIVEYHCGGRTAMAST
jgi:glycosyltransferase involved in cell wall biosynthesis